MPFRKLQRLFPMAVTLHNAEETILMPGWAAKHAAQLSVHPPESMKIRSALLVLTILAFAVTGLSVKKGPQSLWAYLTFGYIIAMLVNVFVPHVPAALLFHSYTPGLVTAVIVNLPVMSFLALRGVRERWVSGWKAVMFAVGVPLCLAVLVGLLFG